MRAANLIWLVLIVILLAGCATQNPANYEPPTWAYPAMATETPVYVQPTETREPKEGRGVIDIPPLWEWVR